MRAFSQSLREYRNLVHPWEQRERGTTPDADTCRIGWEVVQAAMNDLASVPPAASALDGQAPGAYHGGDPCRGSWPLRGRQKTA